MTQHGLRARRARSFCRTTNSKHEYPIAENLLQRDFTSEKPNEKWVSDVTFVRTKESWLYVATILDLYSRRIVGWSASERNDAKLVVAALEKAASQRRPPQGLLIHSDRGSTYAGKEFQSCAKKHGMKSSMSRKGDCWDNAVAESFFSTLKREGLLEVHESRRAAYQAVEEYVSYYNTARLHSTLGYQSPIAFELKMRQANSLQPTVH